MGETRVDLEHLLEDLRDAYTPAPSSRRFSTLGQRTDQDASLRRTAGA